MPYIAAIDFITQKPIKDRERLDPHIFALTEKMRSAGSFEDLDALTPEIDSLADAIAEVAEGYGYEGAFAGELNYSLHMILFGLFPDTGYWVAADITGSLELVLDLFSGRKLDTVGSAYRKEIKDVPFGKAEAFIDVVEWVFVYLALNAAPDHTRRSKRFILGVFRHIDTELYWRLWALYEELQTEKNGDLEGYVQWRAKILEALAKLREERAGVKV